MSKKMYYCLVYTVDDAINFKIYLRSSYIAMADREKKQRRKKKLKYLENKKRFSAEIKNIFHSF